MLALGVLLARADEECARLPVLAIVVGLEGVGHHLFHSYALDPQNSERVFLAAHAAAPSEVRYLRASTGGAAACAARKTLSLIHISEPTRPY